jgi:plastocyanin
MTPRFSRLTLVIPVVAATILAACGSSTSSNNPKPAADVSIVSGAATKGFQAYSPDTFTVTLASGGKVTWRNDNGGVQHTVRDTLAANAFDTGIIAGGDTASIVFTLAGQYPYKCGIHDSMRGLIIVN